MRERRGKVLREKLENEEISFKNLMEKLGDYFGEEEILDLIEEKLTDSGELDDFLETLE